MTEIEHELLQTARAGVRRTLEALLDRHQATIYRFSMALCRDPEDAKDVLQDTLIAMARGIRDFQGASSLSTWLFTIARSFCIKKQRKSKFAPVEVCSIRGDIASEVAMLCDPAKQPDDALADKQIERAVEQAIRALEPSQREVFILRDIEGLTAPEVAATLKISAQAVKSRLHRSRLSVRAHLLPLLALPPDAALGPSQSCPDVLRMSSMHVEDEISADVCADMERHLQSCERCRGACDFVQTDARAVQHDPGGARAGLRSSFGPRCSPQLHRRAALKARVPMSMVSVWDVPLLPSQISRPDLLEPRTTTLSEVVCPSRASSR